MQPNEPISKALICLCLMLMQRIVIQMHHSAVEEASGRPTISNCITMFDAVMIQIIDVIMINKMPNYLLPEKCLDSMQLG